MFLYILQYKQSNNFIECFARTLIFCLFLLLSYFKAADLKHILENH